MPAWTADANALASLATAWARAVNCVRRRFRRAKEQPPTMARPAKTPTMMMAIVPPEATLLLVVVGVLGVVVV